MLEVTGWREHDMSEDARRDMALRILHNRRYEEVLQEWLREIRDEAYVDIKVHLNDKGEPVEGEG